ncbi:hypothetical protein R1flu_027781 [Riccia fluitans]|uniref:Secreted protein n=1 Tax=Riccia fluitans TaxID=41844 RepID=A0ABD1XNV4_9MARC
MLLWSNYSSSFVSYQVGSFHVLLVRRWLHRLTTSATTTLSDPCYHDSTPEQLSLHCFIEETDRLQDPTLIWKNAVAPSAWHRQCPAEVFRAPRLRTTC